MESLLQNGGDAIEIVAAPRRIRQCRIDRKRRLAFVLAEDVLNRQRMSQRFYPGGVDLLELIDIVEDRAELARHRLEVGLAQLQPGKMSHPADIVCGEGHGVYFPRGWQCRG